MFAKEGLGLELKDTRKDNQKKKQKKKTAKKTCKLAGAIFSRKERLAKSDMNAGLQKHSSGGVL